MKRYDRDAFVSAWKRARREGPDFARSIKCVGDNLFIVTDANGRLWRCKLGMGPNDPGGHGKGCGHTVWRVVPFYGPVHPEGTFKASDEDELIRLNEVDE